MKRLTVIGIAATTLWCAIITIMVCSRLTEFVHLPLNAIGDFFSGLSAPLALIWLVVGYFQQGEELRLNTEALHAQQEELRRQVEETAQLAKNAERQAASSEQIALISKTEHERQQQKEMKEAEPIFVADGGSDSRPEVITNITNHGGPIRQVILTHAGRYKMSLRGSPVWESNAGQKLVLLVRPDEDLLFPVDFSLQYIDKLGTRHERFFRMPEMHKIAETHT